MDSPVYNPNIPFSDFINGGFRAGRIARINGKIPLQATNFSIKFLHGHNPGTDDVGLFIHPNFNEHSLTLNSRIGSVWGQPEIKNNLPLVRGQDFEIMILCENQDYKIAMNGHHFTQFNHRLPCEVINGMSVEGEVSVSFYKFEGGVTSSMGSMTQPINQIPLPIPFSGPVYPVPDIAVMPPSPKSPAGGSMGNWSAPMIVPPAGLPYPASPIPRMYHPPPIQTDVFDSPLSFPVPQIGGHEGRSIARSPSHPSNSTSMHSSPVRGKELKKQMKQERKEMEYFLKKEEKKQLNK